MKLYANVSSERASKGQGGNEYINIDLLDSEKNILYRIHYTEKSLKEGKAIFQELLKAKKQKTEIRASDICPKCDIPFGDCHC